MALSREQLAWFATAFGVELWLGRGPTMLVRWRRFRRVRRWVERSPTAISRGGQEHRGRQARSPLRRHTLYDEAKATQAFHQTMPGQPTVIRHAELLPLTESCVEARFKALSGPISLGQVATP